MHDAESPIHFSSSFRPAIWVPTLCIWAITFLVLLGGLYLIQEPNTNTGVIPYLLSPLVTAIFVPLLVALPTEESTIVLWPSITYPAFIGFVFFLSYLSFGFPAPSIGLKAVLFLFSFSMFLIGLQVLLYELSGFSFFGQWLSTMLGVLLVGSFVIFSPVVDLYYGNEAFRRPLIYASTQLNPILAMGGSILGKDLLRSSFMYEHLAIGRFYVHSAPNWRWLSILYLTLGVMTGGTGRYLHRRWQSS